MLNRRQFTIASAAALIGAPAVARAATSQTRVRVGYVPVIGASAIFVLNGAGWAKKAGLDITLTKFDSGPTAIQALASGTLDVMAIGIAPIAVARAKKIDVSVVAGLAAGGASFVASPALAADFAKAQSPAAALTAFRKANGRKAKLATLPHGAVPTTALQHWLQSIIKADPADYEIVAMGIEAVQQAMLAGAIDGGTVLEPSLTVVLKRNPKLKAIVTTDEMFPSIPGTVIAATGAFARDHQPVLDDLIRLVNRATDFIVSKPGEAAPYVQQVLGGGLVPVPVMEESLRSKATRFVTDPRVIIPATKEMLDFQVKLGDFQTAPPTDGLFDVAAYDRAVSKS